MDQVQTWDTAALKMGFGSKSPFAPNVREIFALFFNYEKNNHYNFFNGLKMTS